MSHKTLVNGTSYEISGGKTLVNSTAYSISGGKTLVGGTAYEIGFGGTPVGEVGGLAVGGSVYMSVGGVSTEFLVVHQGLPSSLYDSSCDGTWLLAKDILSTPKWDSTNNDYANSDIHIYMNSGYLSFFDSKIRTAIKQVKIPYWKGTGIGTTSTVSSGVSSGANGLSTRIFLLSGYEVGFDDKSTNDLKQLSVDGAKLDYFISGLATDAMNRRIGYQNGTARIWGLRSPKVATNSTTTICRVNTNGYYTFDRCNATSYWRPAMILPKELGYDENFNVIA